MNKKDIKNVVNSAEQWAAKTMNQYKELTETVGKVGNETEYEKLGKEIERDFPEALNEPADKLNIVADVESYLNKYVTFEENFYSLPCALWAIATHAWPEFDAFPYLGITAGTKKAGKTTLKDCMVPLAANGQKFSVSSASSMFRVMEEGSGSFPSMFVDECEALADESHPAREFLNKGFERGEYITRTIANQSVKFECYCPKAFVGIGGVYDTLRDRAIIISMKRRSPVESAKAIRIRQAVRDGEATELREKISAAINDSLYEIRDMYAKAEILSFLDERAEKCWTPLFIVARILCPERIEELTSIAVDMEALKSAPQLKATGSDWEAREKAADDEEARVLLLRDMLKLAEGKEYLGSGELLEQLKAIPVAQWRKFRGRGLTNIDMGHLLDSLNVHPKVIRIKGTSGYRGDEKSTMRGYKTADLIAAAKLAGLIESD